jgi:hypothetical protein
MIRPKLLRLNDLLRQEFSETFDDKYPVPDDDPEGRVEREQFKKISPDVAKLLEQHKREARDLCKKA